MRLRRRSIVWLALGASFAAPPLVAVYLMLGEQGNLPTWLTPPQHLFRVRPRGPTATPPDRRRPPGQDGAATSAAPPA